MARVQDERAGRARDRACSSSRCSRRGLVGSTRAKRSVRLVVEDRRVDVLT